MTTIADDELYLHAKRVNGKVALITGAASGIGRETALQFAKHGAKVVLGDLNTSGLDRVVTEISRRGGTAVGQKCDVTNWDEQIALFDLAISKYGSLDFVIANAGVNEIGSFHNIQLRDDGRPIVPELKTLDVNLTGTVYTVHLALHFLEVNRSSPDSLKAIAMIGSMASWQANPKGPVYSAAKHGVLGLARALYPLLRDKNIRVSIVHPFFADTALLTLEDKLMTAGIPKTPLARVGGTILFSTTDPSHKSNGSVWLLPDSGPAFRLEKDTLKEGVYKIMNERNKLLMGPISNLRIAADFWNVFGKQIMVGLIPIVAGTIVYAKL